MLGCAVGDALGAPVEFWSLDRIRAQYGPEGIQEFDKAFGRVGAITDDTQMTLFVAEGIIRAECRFSHRGLCAPEVCVENALLRWLYTQGVPRSEIKGRAIDNEVARKKFTDGWLIKNKRLFALRAPGNTCIQSLRFGAENGQFAPDGRSKGAGAVMRSAPVGLFLVDRDDRDVYRFGCEFAKITHLHPSGYTAAGLLGVLIHRIIHGVSLVDAVERAIELGTTDPEASECVLALCYSRDLSQGLDASVKLLESLGGGWVAEEALAIAVYCALHHQEDFESGIRLAVNHSGDSDTTGAITGNILGALLGESAIPERWRKKVEMAKVIGAIAEDLLTQFQNTDEWWKRYPGW